MQSGRVMPHRTLRVILYFAFAPDEVLTLADMRVKFATFPLRQSIVSHLRAPLKAGLLRSYVDKSMGGRVFCAGPTLIEIIKGRIR